MNNRKFTTWALSQFISLTVALAKNSRIREENEDTLGFITEFLMDMENCSNKVSCMAYGNFVFTYDKKTRKTGILNIHSNKFVTVYCSPNDFMDIRVGLGACWAKYNNVERPKFPVKTRLSELKPHDIFSLYTSQKYEFIGTTSNGRYVGRYFNGNGNGKGEFVSFCEDNCSVWE